MPELPEVETFVRFLKRQIVGKKILKAKIFWPTLLKKPTIEEFYRLISKEIIEKVARRGKFILIFLTNYVLVVHLRMEGKFLTFYDKNTQPKLGRHCSARFYLSNNYFLDYEDSRKFGTFHLESKSNYKQNPGLKKVGHEPFSKKISPSYLHENWKKTKRPIKSVILDQNVIAGIGNIYASEILFLCQISPLRPARDLSTADLKKFIFFYRQIMKKAILLKGTTAKSFEVNHQPGAFWNYLNVYQRDKTNCPVCGEIILSLKISGRNSFFCKKCQKN